MGDNMSKNMEMLNTFFKVMFNNKGEINKVIPDMYSKSFYSIDFDYLLSINKTSLILDIDGTILPVDDINVPKELIDKINILKDNNFNICLMTNNNETRVLPVAKILDVKYLYKAGKPLPDAYNKALKVLNVEDKSTVAMVGDQMLSDIKGANQYGIYSILVCPIDSHNNIQTKTQRILQRRMENHLRKKHIFDRDKYYNIKEGI